ncbi:nuclear transport factor 2 family protein [Aureitalea sp. L0-47]|uniref:nuclear transport factor 2 family protein n=1 Tax=Aureitalea sp. L0-47 TaxID=2816962 RepID=UPI002236F4C5|nr:nuclear transport factor 2 family protein [Aureitalea sp. L0-47]MCW5520456.1 nuclear transport factor 2 family protein [Aureitalea sp. L0-47]
MNKEHPNIAIVKKFDPNNIDTATDVLAGNAEFHFFNPLLPEIKGTYVGLEGFRDFFQKMGEICHKCFNVNPVSITAIGDELVVVHSKNEMILDDRELEVDAVIVWRIVEGKISEVWDIPSIHPTKVRELVV